MVAKAGGYYGSAFGGYRVLTQGYPLPPTIFNVVVYAVVRNWVAVMVKSAEEHSGCVQEVRHQNALFCADDSMVALSDPILIQEDFSALLGLFDRVFLNTNSRKTVGILCRPCQVAVTQSEAA